MRRKEEVVMRLLRGETGERRYQLTHPPYERPEILAERPNELWGWDISKLKGPAKWTYYYLYVILDVFSRYAVGWPVAHCDHGGLGGGGANLGPGADQDQRRELSHRPAIPPAP